MSRIVHFEIQASDPEVLARYHAALFDWKISRPGDAPYGLVETGDATRPGINGGLLKRNGPSPIEGQSVNAFVCTVAVTSVDESFERALKLGGKAALSKMPIPAVGWLAYVKDPDGNILGLMQPDPTAM